MAENLVQFSQDRDKLLSRFRYRINKEDFFNASLLGSRLENEKYPELNFYKAKMYDRLENDSYCVDSLIKCVATPNFVNYNIPAAIAKISIFFYSYLGKDVAPNYISKIKTMFPQNVKVQSIQMMNITEPKKSLHFVGEGNDLFNDSLRFYTSGKMDKVKEILSQIKSGHPQYLKARILLSIVEITEQNYKKATDILLNLIEDGYESEDLIINLYRIAMLNNNEKNRIIHYLSEEQYKNQYVSLAIRSAIYVEDNRTVEAIELLEQLKIPYKFKEEYLELLAICYDRVGNNEEKKEVLKKIAAIYPNNIMARYLYLMLEAEKDVVIPIDFKKVNSATRKEFKKYIKQECSIVDYFNSVSREQARFILLMAMRVRDYNFTKDIANRIYNSKHRSLIFDLLISVQIHPINEQLLFQVLVENKYNYKFTLLREGILEDVKLQIPNAFSELEEDKEKYSYLLTCYAQTYSLNYYSGIDVSCIASELNPMFEKLFKMNLLETEHLNIAQNIVYISSLYLSSNNELVMNSFGSIPDDVKKDLNKIMEDISK